LNIWRITFIIKLLNAWFVNSEQEGNGHKVDVSEEGGSMKRGCFVGLVVLFYVFLVGMGGLGGSASVRVPEPTKNYDATVTDQSNISTRLEKFSLDGQTFLSGKLGDAYISISFDKIESIEFVLQDKTLTAEVQLKDGKTVPVVVDKGTPCYGKLAYGNFKIAVEDVRSITLHGKAPREKKP